jgi:hypothetical protein
MALTCPGPLKGVPAGLAQDPVFGSPASRFGGQFDQSQSSGCRRQGSGVTTGVTGGGSPGETVTGGVTGVTSGGSTIASPLLQAPAATSAASARMINAKCFFMTSSFLEPRQRDPLS